MTDYGPFTKRKGGRQAAPFEADAGVSNCINTAMKAMKPAGADAL